MSFKINKVIYMKLNKKIRIPVIMVLSVFLLTGVFGAIVSYYSNTADMDVNVQSPMSISFAEIEHGETLQDAIDNTASVTDWSEELLLSETTGLSTSEVGL